MKKINIKDNHLQLYKRDNSKLWQIKIKLPNHKSIRKTSGTTILQDAKKIALNYYQDKRRSVKKKLFFSKNYIYKSKHLIESKKLKKNEIECFLNESKKYIGFNNQKLKKSDILKGIS